LGLKEGSTTLTFYRKRGASMFRSLWLRQWPRALFVRKSSSRKRRRAWRCVQFQRERLEERVTPSITITGSNNLTGKNNAQVAAYFQKLFSMGGTMVQAQTLAIALNIYATTSSLGGTWSASYGFTVTAWGLLDWDKAGRNEQVQITDATTGTVLN